MALQQPCNYHDSWYASLLSLAEYFRTCKPMRVRECIQCMEAIVQLTLPSRIGARTHLQLGQIYAHFTKNVDLARTHLERALASGRSQSGCEDVIGESSCALATLYCQAGQNADAKQLLYQAVELIRAQPYWYCRLLFFVAQLNVNDGDYAAAQQALSAGVDYTQAAGAIYTNALFLLTKGMLLIIEKRPQEANATLIRANNVIETLNTTAVRKQSLKAFLLVLQVCYCLSSGNAETKQYLKELQGVIQVITKSQDPEPIPRHPLDCFQWMPKEHLCVVVYIVTVLHEMQCGQHDVAQMHAEKAFMQVQKLKQQSNGGSGDLLLHAFELLLIEHDVLCRLSTGSRTLAIKEIQAACELTSRFPRLFETHKAQLHTLLGLYGIATNCLPAAEGQFNSALQLMRDADLSTFVNLNLAIVYLWMGREQEFCTLWDRVSRSQPQSASKALRAASYYVKGLYEFFCGRFDESKQGSAQRQLREALQLALSDDINRVVSNSLVVLGHIFLALNDAQEGLNMTVTAMQLGRKTSDVSVQLWSVTLLRDVYRARQDAAKYEESCQVHNALAQNWVQDQRSSLQQPEHDLLQWFDGPCPTTTPAPQFDQFAVPAAVVSDGAYAYQDPGQLAPGVHQS